MIANKVDLDVQDEYGDTALHLAIKTGHIGLAELLIANKVDLNIQGKSGNTALHLAIKRGYIDLAELLIANKANLNILNNYGNTVLLIAARKGYDNLVKKIVKANVDLSVTDIDNNNILTYYRYQSEMIELLMFHGLDYHLLRTKDIALINIANNNQSSHDTDLIIKIYSHFMDANPRISLELKQEGNDKYTAKLKNELKAVITNNKNLEFKNLFLELVKQKLKERL